MKLTPFLPVILVAIAVAGCKSTSSTAPAAPSAAKSALPSLGDINTASFVDAFKNADADTIRMVQNAATSIGNKDWSGALGSLQKIRRIPGLTASQESAVNSLISSVGAKAK
ncbi:MAG TPA: hypothetical protein PLX89_11610 [Verrucomicrobiota bacterium]|nr:hypothetical protein [Verrucomicrobiota bacterium]